MCERPAHWRRTTFAQIFCAEMHLYGTEGSAIKYIIQAYFLVDERQASRNAVRHSKKGKRREKTEAYSIRRSHGPITLVRHGGTVDRLCHMSGTDRARLQKSFVRSRFSGLPAMSDRRLSMRHGSQAESSSQRGTTPSSLSKRFHPTDVFA